VTVEEDVDALRRATREAHETLQACRLVIRDMKQMQEEFRTELDQAMEERVADIVKVGLESYRASIDTAISNATATVFNRFDTIADLLLGEHKSQRRRGELGLTDAARQIGEQRAAALASDSGLPSEPTVSNRQEGQEPSSTLDS